MMLVVYLNDEGQFIGRPIKPTLLINIYETSVNATSISGKNEENFFSSRQAAEILVDGLPSLQNSEVSSKYPKPCFKFYRVFKNDAAVTAVSTNDFKPFKPVLLK